ncbi:hypothetical protein KUTeg_017844 [Tegillarca granosa]|uniref:Mediator of RNA polymerase II transcription subunit 27 n=1 Tax=Tegillarca granosa TaxID=220873 RepID=A0ABQ9EIK9_TEGGR|nr:hypothetical protein KUTeg_017844 [Tegillarca granosa]
MADNDAEKLNQAIKLTQKLRSNVTKVFTDLSDGFHNTQGNEKKLLGELQKYLLAVHKLADYASLILSQNALKRTQQFTGPGHSVKRQRRLPPIAHNYPASSVDSLINMLDRYWPDMSITISRPMGNCAVLQITLAKTLRALVVLRGLLIEYVTVKAYNEDFLSEDGKIEIWSKSRYQVFQKVSDLVTAGTLHFYHPQIPDTSLRSFLLWFNSYKTLFSAPCQKCGKHLQGSLPPVWRDTRSAAPQHEGCRQ